MAIYRLYVQGMSLYKLYYKRSEQPLLRPKDVVSSGTRLRLLFHVLMVLSFGLELPQYFAWVTTSDVDIHIHTNKTHLESSHLRASTRDSGSTFGHNMNYETSEKHPQDASKSRNMRLFKPTKDYWIDLYPFHMFTFVTFFTAFTIVINEWHNVAKPVDSSGDDRIRQLRERCFWKFLMVLVNVIVFVGMLVTIVTLVENIQEGSKFQENTFYKIFMVCIIVTQMMLAFMATTFGMSLMSRIQSVAGYQQSMSKQFKAMMCRLVLIMSICFVCFSARVLVIALNTFLGHWGTGPNTDVFLLFLALDSWIPVWIPGSALLYLMRQTPEQRFRGSRPSQTRYTAGGDTGGWKRPPPMEGTNDDDDMDDFSNDSGLGRSSVSDIVHNRINQSTDDEF